MHKLKLYLDTTILNFAFADDAPKEMEDTLKFLKQIDRLKSVYQKLSCGRFHFAQLKDVGR
jgi:hypothetical protein